MASIPRDDSSVPGSRKPYRKRELRHLADSPLPAYGVSLFLPLTNLIFLGTAPHTWDAALAWTLPVWLCIYADLKSPDCPNREAPERSSGVFDGILYLLFVLQLANIGLLLRAAAQLEWSTAYDIATAVANIAAMRIMTGTNSCCSGIAVAHELIHRKSAHRRWMGRILLWTVCYDHFFVEHRQGHHRRAGTREDPATARFGESYGEFWRRTWKQQFLSAWRLESQRLASTAGAWGQHRVLQGIVIQAALILGIAAYFGPVALALFLYQALAAVHLLEAVNYFQHWGLSRASRRFDTADAWTSESWFTRHAFLGLSRHADHHTRAGQPFQRLVHRNGSPQLPCGYFAMAILVKLFNSRYRMLATRELKARKLGPFRDEPPFACKR